MCTCRSASITSASLLPPPAAPPYSASGSGRLINSACRGWGRQTTGTLACTMLMVLPPPSAAAPRRTPLLLPVPPDRSGSWLHRPARSLSTAVASLRSFMVPAPDAPSFFAAFCRAFSSRTCCASRVLRVSVARLRLASPLACFVCPMVLGISSFPPWCAGLWQKDTTGAAFPTVCTFTGP